LPCIPRASALSRSPSAQPRPKHADEPARGAVRDLAIAQRSSMFMRPPRVSVARPCIGVEHDVLDGSHTGVAHCRTGFTQPSFVSSTSRADPARKRCIIRSNNTGRESASST
jgi:hypothetical protein